MNVDVKFVDKNHIYFSVYAGDRSYFIFCTYGEPVDRPKLCERLTWIGINIKDPWCMMRDFNEIRHNGEKIGGPHISGVSFEPLNNIVQISDMLELPSSGNEFTRGGMRGKLRIQSILDCAFGKKSWLKLFPTSNQISLISKVQITDWF